MDPNKEKSRRKEVFRQKRTCPLQSVENLESIFITSLVYKRRSGVIVMANCNGKRSPEEKESTSWGRIGEV